MWVSCSYLYFHSKSHLIRLVNFIVKKVQYNLAHVTFVRVYIVTDSEFYEGHKYIYIYIYVRRLVHKLLNLCLHIVPKFYKNVAFVFNLKHQFCI